MINFFDDPKVGLALGGGAALGAAHIGVLKALEERNIQITYVSGTSIGAMIGAFYAFGTEIKKIEEIAVNLKWLDVSSLSISKMGLLSNKKLGNLIRKHLGDVNIEDAEKPLAITATDLSSGQKVVFKKGDLATAVMASTCVPGIFIPVESDGKMLVDGVLVENVPIQSLKTMGAEQIIAVDINALRLYKKPDDIIEVVTNALDIAIENLSNLSSSNKCNT
ncbi:patatin-like phospholipase family protein [Aliifodinibius sp. S!AR15-10]|uniref:patatin-like phospholipase family protein n=1 Tax=Aliifodinibius sp. S!AR15-10 TaxID=2950437 RepID=UPI00285C7721|nr:patatin-like phospholipase family protein [Aliifodinibius sp. S!AR15-10]MDR8391538.1 patatin-like phospholipase family protein [Aliifodinibius sp. S!AR15-10]